MSVSATTTKLETPNNKKEMSNSEKKFPNGTKLHPPEHGENVYDELPLSMVSSPPVYGGLPVRFPHAFDPQDELRGGEHGGLLEGPQPGRDECSAVLVFQRRRAREYLTIPCKTHEMV